MTSTEYKFHVDVPCDGCVNAVRRSLGKQFGTELENVDANLETKIFTITLKKADAPYTYDQVYEALLKTGKTVTKLQ